MTSIKAKRRELISEVEEDSKVHHKYGMSYPIFSNVPEELKLTEKDIGKEVWVAGESRTTTAHLREYHEAGDYQFPKGGVVIKYKGEATMRALYLDQVILHPDEIKKSQEQIDYEKAVEKAKKQKYENPLTGRDCSYRYSLREGFITETGEKIPLEEMKFENPETGRMVSYSYAKKKGII